MTGQSTRAADSSSAVEALVARVADEFGERRARGERPDPEEYATRHPEAATLIRDVLAVFGMLGASSGVAEARPEGGAAPAQVLGDFRIVREVGRGGMGVVYEAEQLSLPRRVALKVLPFAAVADPRHLQRFGNEARAAATLDHPNAVRVYGVGCERGVHYIAMQFVDGRSLAELIRQRRCKVATSPANGADATRTYPDDGTDTTAPAGAEAPPSSRTKGDAAYFRQVAEWGAHAAGALEHAHSLGVVHRDVKPANLLVDARGELRVADFGLAKLAGDPGVTGTGDLLGTVRYMSPEQAAARHDLVDHRSDVYSLGATLYELLTLAPAFDGPDRQAVLSGVLSAEPAAPRSLERSIPRDLETVVLKAMEKEPARRYQSAGELAADLRRFLADEPVRAKRRTIGERVAKWTRRNRVSVAVAFIAGMLALGTGAAAAGWAYRDRVAREQTAASALERTEKLYREGNWRGALAEARLGWAAVAGRGGGEVQDQLAGWLRDLEFVERLEEARLQRDDAFRFSSPASYGSDTAGTKEKYAGAFREYGLDLYNMTAEEAGAAVARTRVAPELVAVLDDWAFECGDWNEQMDRYLIAQVWNPRYVAAVARTADPDPARCRVRSLLGRKIDPVEVKGLRASLGVAGFPRASGVLLGRLFQRAELFDEAVEVFRAVWVQHPADFWVNLELAFALAGQRRPQEAGRHFTAAIALRPQLARPALARLYACLGLVLSEAGRAGEAQACRQQALRLQPDLSHAVYDLGRHLVVQRPTRMLKPEGEIWLRAATFLGLNFAEAHLNMGLEAASNDSPAAAAHFREAIRLKPDYLAAHFHLAAALDRAGRSLEAIDSYREVLRLLEVAHRVERVRNPGSDLAPRVHESIGTILLRMGRTEEAVDSFRKAIALWPHHYSTHRQLGSALLKQGRFQDALAMYCRGQELAIPQNHPSAAEDIEYARMLVELDGKLPAIAAGKVHPASPSEALAFAEVAFYRRWYATSARLYRNVLAIDRKFSFTVRGRRYSAACAAARAGCVRGEGPAKPTEEEQAKFRKQSLWWLTTELDVWAVIEGRGAAPPALAVGARGEMWPVFPAREGGAAHPALILGELRHWRADPDLACVREEAELKKLPETEQADWRKLWADHAALVKRVEGRLGGKAPELAPPPRPVAR
jgi:serine/threonine protein kinase/Flp pilus assembly protein TadD